MSSTDSQNTVEARLIERVLTDPGFRAAFRRSPAEACRACGLEDLAEELGSGSSLQTLELRESKSSLAGVLIALGAEGVGIAELTGLLGYGSQRPSPGAGAVAHNAALEGPLAAPSPHHTGAADSHPAEPSQQPNAGAEAVAATAAAPGGASGVAALLESPRLSMPAQVRDEFLKGAVDPRVVSVLQEAVTHHTLAIGGLQSVSDPVHAESLEIVAVDGQQVGPTNIAARDLLTEITALDPSLRPNEIVSPWAIQAPGCFADPSHSGQLRLSFVSSTDFPRQSAAGSGGAGPPNAGPVAATPAAQGAARAAADAAARPDAPPADGHAGPAEAANSHAAAEPRSAVASNPAPRNVAASPTPSGYVSPLPADARIGRTDMGVDVDLTPGEPIVAIGDSRVLGVMPNWYAGQPYVALQILSGPLKGRNYYVAEQIVPTVTPGEIVNQGQVIAHYAASGTGIEIGWAAPNWQQTLAQAQGNTGDATHNDAPAGVAFHTFLLSLGHAKAGGSAPRSAADGAGGCSPPQPSQTPQVMSQPTDTTPPRPKPQTAVFTAVPQHKHRAFQRKTVEFRAVSAQSPSPPRHPAVAHAASGLSEAPGGTISVSSPHLTSGQEQFATRLAQLTGLDARVISAWELAEESGGAAQGRQAAGNFNWLNIGYFDSGTGAIAFDAAFKDPITAAEQTAKFLKGTWGGASDGIRAILATVGQNPEQQMSAIANSGWASSHYDNGSNLRATYNELSDIVITKG